MTRPLVARPSPPGRIRRLGSFAMVVACFAAGLRVAAVAAPISEPLAARSGPAGSTLFATVEPSASGLVSENRYADPTMWWERYQEFTVGAIGTGIAVGDYDGDGLPDVFVVSKTESCRLFRNLGAWRFEDVTERAGVADRGSDAAIWKQGAAFADVNNDGHLDLYLCRFGAPNRLYLNRGDGTFREEAASRGLALADASGMAAFADYDRDGWLDVYIQTNLLDAKHRPHGQRDRLFRNVGEGRFREVTDEAGIQGETQGHAALWWDFDEDGWPDLYVANDFEFPDQLYRNNHDGTFRNVAGAVLPGTPYSAMGADLGDVDGDGRIDLLVADMAATTRAKDQRGMADSRTVARDPVVTSEVAPQLLRNALFLNSGVGRMREAAHLAGIAATDWTWSVRFEDFDNDGRLDLHVTNGMVRELHNTDLLSRMMLAESPAERIRIMRSSPVLAEANLAYRNAGDLRFVETGKAWGLDQVGVSFGAATADFDGDGDLDLIFANYQAPVTLLRNDSQGGHRLLVSLRGERSNRFGVGARVEVETASGVQVRTLVLSRGYLSTSEPVLHFGLGNEARIRRLTVRWPSGAVQEFRDLAVDRRYRVVEDPTGPTAPAIEPPPTPWLRDVTAELAPGIRVRQADVDETAAQPLLPIRHDRRGPALVAEDLDGDRKDDLLIGGSVLDSAMLVQTGDASVRALRVPSAGASPTLVNDGPMLVVRPVEGGPRQWLITRGGVSEPAGTPAYQPTLWQIGANGAAEDASALLPPLPLSVGAVVAADFNRDGTPEIFVGGRVEPGRFPEAPRSVILAWREGRWIDATEQWSLGRSDLGMVTAALATDADGDGWTDLVVTLDWGGVRFLRNRAGRAFEDQSESIGFAAAGRGAWSALAEGDFNGDGRPDFVLGNLGLNTPYHVGDGRTAVLLVGEFRPDADPVLIEAERVGGVLFPRRTAKQLAAVVPSIRRRFPKVNDFARASVDDLFDPDAIAAARMWEVTETRSGVLLSSVNGPHRFAPLPTEAQLAPVGAVLVDDIDGDGNSDLVLGQNSRAPVPSIGWFEGGLGVVLRGDGRGGFVAVPSAQSGWVVTGQATAVVAIDLDADGRKEVVVSRSDAPLLVFRRLQMPR